MTKQQIQPVQSSQNYQSPPPTHLEEKLLVKLLHPSPVSRDQAAGLPGGPDARAGERTGVRAGEEDTKAAPDPGPVDLVALAVGEASSKGFMVFFTYHWMGLMPPNGRFFLFLLFIKGGFTSQNPLAVIQLLRNPWKTLLKCPKN